MKAKLIIAGYLIALFCFIASIIFRMTNAEGLAVTLLLLGDIMLIITSLFKIFIAKENKK